MLPTNYPNHWRIEGTDIVICCTGARDATREEIARDEIVRAGMVHLKYEEKSVS